MTVWNCFLWPLVMILKDSLQTVTHRAMRPLASLKGDAEVRTFVDHMEI